MTEIHCFDNNFSPSHNADVWVFETSWTWWFLGECSGVAYARPWSQVVSKAAHQPVQKHKGKLDVNREVCGRLALEGDVTQLGESPEWQQRSQATDWGPLIGQTHVTSRPWRLLGDDNRPIQLSHEFGWAEGKLLPFTYTIGLPSLFLVGVARGLDPAACIRTQSRSQAWKIELVWRTRIKLFEELCSRISSKHVVFFG